MKKIIDLCGKKFNKLLVIEFVCRKNKHSYFKCKCDCGNESTVTSNNLRRNHTTSCGCDSSRNNIGQRSITHGLRKHPIYISWCAMINRCYWAGHNRSTHYMGKGIVICKEWRDDFMSFYDWSINNGWEHGLSIDRINNDGNYSPENCRWVTNKAQSRNRSTNLVLKIDGVSKIAIEWAEQVGVRPGTIYRRKKIGWSDKECVFGRV